MKYRLYYWTASLVLGGLFLTGCSSASPNRSAKTPKSGADKVVASQDDKPRRSKAGATEKEIESQAHYGTGVYYDLSGQSELALEEYWKAAQANPTYEPIVIEVARRLIRNKKSDRAIELLGKAVSSSKASGNLYALLGLAYGQAGRTQDAITANRTAIKKSPLTLAAYQNLAQLYLQSSKTNEAVQILDEASRQSSADAIFLVELSDLYSRYARLKTLNGEALKEQTRKLLNRAAKLKPTDPMVLQKLGDGFFGLEDFPKAEKVYLQLLESFPDVPLIRAKLADVYLRMDKKEKASEQLEAITKDDPTNPRTYSILGAIAMDQQKYAEAVQYFERAIWLNPEFEPVYYDLAGAHLELEKPEEALAVLQKARARFKLSFILEFYTGISHVALKKYSDAVKFLTSAEVLAKTDDPSRLTHQFYYQFASAYERAGDHDSAEKYLKKCLELQPDYAGAMNDLGYMWAESGVKLPEARALIEKAVKLEPDNAAYLDSLAWVLFKLDQSKEALVWMLKAVEHSKKPDATLFDHLGDIYAALKQLDRAREAWGKSLAVEANAEIKKKLESAQAAERAR